MRLFKRLIFPTVLAAVDISLPTQYIQRFRLSFSDNPHPAFASLIQSWEIAEFEVYGHGYVLTVLYRSKVFELESASALGQLRFSGFEDRDAKLRIRTRTGRAQRAYSGSAVSQSGFLLFVRGKGIFSRKQPVYAF